MKVPLKIEFEGTDGAGKTTGLKYFIEQAQKRGLSVVETREVGNPNIASCIKMREFVLDPESKLSGEAMELIFSAMRFENDLWLTKLSESENPPDLVVSDRGWLSHLSYTDHNVSEEFTEDLYENFLAQRTALPHLVLYFKVSTDVALKRRVKRGSGMDVIEMKGIGYQEKVRESFDKYLDVYYGAFGVYEIDADADLENVKKQLDAVLESIIKLSAGTLMSW